MKGENLGTNHCSVLPSRDELGVSKWTLGNERIPPFYFLDCFVG